MALTVAAVETARRRAMARMDLGDPQGARAELTRLIDAVISAGDNRFTQPLYYLYQDRASVFRRANRWEEALADITSAEALVEGLPPMIRGLGRVTVAHARALIRSDPFNPRADDAEALREIARARAAGAAPYIVDDFESRLARRAGEWQHSAALAERAAEALEHEGWTAAAGSCRRRAAEALVDAGDLAAAERQLDIARARADETGSRDDRAHVELVSARLLSARDAHDDAWTHAQIALEQFDALIHSFRTLEDQQRFLVDKLDAYADVFAIALRKGGDEGTVRAWAVAERSKSFYLSQLLASTDVDLLGDTDPGASSELQQLDRELDRLDTERGRLASDRNGERRRLLAAERDVSERKRSLLQRLMMNNPDWARARTPAAFDLSDIIARMPERWCLVSYYWGHTGLGDTERTSTRTLHVFWTDAGRRPRHVVSQWSKPDLDLLLDSRRRLRGVVNTNAALLPAALSDLLLPAELRRSIPDDNNVLVSPHGWLQLLPLHAVEIRPGDYAARHWAMQYVPTLALLALSRAGKVEPEALVIGCSVNGFGDPPLTTVDDEVNTIAGGWSAAAYRVRSTLVPPDGSPESCNIAAHTWGKYRILHIACHGDFPEGRPFDASLRLGAASVRASEFFHVKLHAEVVSLSACSVGRHAERVSGEPVIGDEWIGLYLPLLYGGARFVVASLWSAESDSAAVFMAFFHTGLQCGDAAPNALHWAQNQMAHLPPSFWANWYPVGCPWGSTISDRRSDG